MNENGPVQHDSPPQPTEGEVMEELLSRYERVLVFAGQLQERLKQQKLLAEKNEHLEDENEKLRRVVSAAEAYIKVLESAVEAMKD